MDTRYTSRSLRRRRNTDQWECSLSHTDPVTGEVVRTYHTLVVKTQRQAERARDALIVELELLGGTSSSNVSLRDFMASFMRHKEDSGTIELSTVRGYRAETRIIRRYLGNVKLAELSIPDVSGWMHDMGADGYAPKSCSKAFRLLKQALKWAVASYLGHASVSMTLDIYADVDPEAKRAAVDKVADSFDVDLDSLYDFPNPSTAPSASAVALTFSVDQLKALLAAAEEREASHGRL